MSVNITYIGLFGSLGLGFGVQGSGCKWGLRTLEGFMYGPKVQSLRVDVGVLSKFARGPVQVYSLYFWPKGVPI